MPSAECGARFVEIEECAVQAGLVEVAAGHLDSSRISEATRFERLEARGTDEPFDRRGSYPLELIETRRHWFTGPVEHDTGGTVNVLNLVQGPAAVVESPSSDFEPLIVHYAERFVVPASVGRYDIRPLGEAETPLATVKAYIRE